MHGRSTSRSMPGSSDHCPTGLGIDLGDGVGQFNDYARRETARVRVRPYLSPIADAYAASDLVLARAGAMTTAELCAWGLPMVLVPLPTAAADHQTANARALAAAGAAIHVATARALSSSHRPTPSASSRATRDGVQRLPRRRCCAVDPAQRRLLLVGYLA